MRSKKVVYTSYTLYFLYPLAVEAASGLPEYLQWLAAESRPVN